MMQGLTLGALLAVGATFGALVVSPSLGRAVAASQAAGNQDRSEQVALAPANAPVIDYVFVEKGKRQLSLWSDGWLVKSYTIRLGRTPEGQKTQQGDGRTPEGLYTIDFRKPDSSYHLALHISYPSDQDRARADAYGVQPGGAIMIHGFPNDTDTTMATRIHRYVDWTEGCIAMTNAEIEELWRLVPEGTAIEIVP
jgi:murein L,D-transpeptidase YafK